MRRGRNNGLMPHSKSPAANPGKRRTPLRIASIGGGFLFACGVAYFMWMRTNPPRQDETAPSNPQVERAEEETVPKPSAWASLVQASPYRNVRPDVAYVSDASCAECHSDIAASYAKHPMGRSLSPVGVAETIENFTLPLTIDGHAYQVRRDGDRQFHREARLSPTGKEALVTEFEAVYAVGSGRTGRSYLIERDEHLFVSPMTWYADHGWDLSPGYEKNNSHFNRPVVAECLFCHANRALHVEGTTNQYQSPIFAGHAIGCQRCHGPGELHVAARENGGADEAVAAGPDFTIVNPAHLEPRLSEAICQQCHLGGLVRVETRGRQREDFRPGLPWSAVEAVYLPTAPTDSTPPAGDAPAGEPVDRFVGHVEQMHQSGCYTGSMGKLGCISCHDPHRLPEEAVKAEYYRGRCLDCHGEADCQLPQDERRAQQADDSCIACHMPRESTQIRHAAATDHRIPRSPTAPPPRRTIVPSPTWSPLIAFDAFTLPRDPSSAPAVNDPDQSRNLAIALMMAMTRYPEVVNRSLLPQTIGLLQQAVEHDPSDAPARESLALALGRSRDLSSAARHLEDVLQRHPRRETTLAAAASLLSSAGQWSAAAEKWDHARKLNPWIVRYWFELARCYAQLGRWSDCAATCTEAVKRFPDSFGARQLLIESQLVAGRLGDAQREYERMLELNPPKVESVQRWWDNHPLRQQSPSLRALPR